MATIISIDEVSSIVSSGAFTGKTIVVTGGCFDILHIGHVKFLAAAKKSGDILFVLLEHDDRVRQLKGENRPIFSQKERAEVLSHLVSVDYVILLPVMKSDEDYKHLIQHLQPNVVAVTEHDPNIEKKTKHTKNAKAHIVPHVDTFSSSKLAQILGIE